MLVIDDGDDFIGRVLLRITLGKIAALSIGN